MEDAGAGKPNNINQELENARTGYQAAITMWAHEVGLFWGISNALLLANSLIVGVVTILGLGLGGTASSVNSPESRYWLVVLVVFFGFCLCVLWSHSLERTLHWQKYWIWSARELEEKFLKQPVQTLSRGGRLADAKDVKAALRIDGNEELLELPLILKSWKGRHSARALVVIFFLAYIVLLAHAVATYCSC